MSKPKNPYPRKNPPSCCDLINHSSLFTPKKVYSVGPGNNDKDKDVFVYVGYNLANITFVKAPAGWVVVDTGQDVKQAEDVWKDFSEQLPKDERKIAAIVLTHHHSDHVNGTQFFVDNNLFVDGKVKIYGANNLDAEYQQENGLIGPLMTCRALAQYNSILLHSGNPADTEGMNSGIGPIITATGFGYVKPNILIPTNSPFVPIKYTIGGRDFEIVHVPSEANSEIALYLADKQILFSAEVIQDHTFPNLYTLRGSNFRDPSNWYRSIQSFLTNWPKAQYMVLQHGPPILKNDVGCDPNDVTTQPIATVLTNYRDAIQYVRDQTLRWALKGYAKDEIMHLVHLPEQQANYSPWLKQFYGTVKHSVPAVYNGYIGWFDGDPVALNPLPRSIISKKLIDLMGGREKVLSVATEAYEKGNAKADEYDRITNPTAEQKELIVKAHEDWQYAAELATFIIRERPYEKLTQVQDHQQKPFYPLHLLHPTDADGDSIWWNARYLKGACFRQIGFRNICANWRGTYLTAGYELEGKEMTKGATATLKIADKFNSKTSSVEYTISELQVRVKPEACKGVDSSVYLEEVKNNGSTALYRLRIRNSVLVATDYTGTLAASDTKISGSTQTLNLLLNGDEQGGYDEVLGSKDITITPDGNLARAKLFFTYFDGGRCSTSPNIFVH